MISSNSSSSFVIISGFSGAGRSTVLRSFEDYGFTTIDNLPLCFLEKLKDLYKTPVAVSIDTRTLGFSIDVFLKTVNDLKSKWDISFLFLECKESILLKRYKQSRRPHPLFGPDITLAISKESQLLQPLRAAADAIFDTSYTTPEQTQLWVRETFCKNPPKLMLMFLSFSYRHGIPPQADIVLDGRFLKNPYYEETLRPLTGKDSPVENFLKKDAQFDPYIENCLRLLHLSLIGFKERGRSYVTIAIGCTGGQHRSVFLVEELAKRLKHDDLLIGIEHREQKKVEIHAQKYIDNNEKDV